MENNIFLSARDFSLNMVRSCTLSLDNDLKYYHFTEDTALKDLFSDSIDRVELSFKLEELNNNKSFFSVKEIGEWRYVRDVVDSFSNLI
jgi:acyl carrier protein